MLVDPGNLPSRDMELNNLFNVQEYFFSRSATHARFLFSTCLVIACPVSDEPTFLLTRPEIEVPMIMLLNFDLLH